MTTPQSPVVPITAETVVPFPCWLYDKYRGWWRAGADNRVDLFSPSLREAQTHYCQNPPDRMPGAVSEHQTGSDAPKEPTRFHDGDPCARAAKKCASILAPFNHYADKEAEAANEFEAIIRREVAGHYEKEMEWLRSLIEQQSKTLGIIKTSECDLRTRLATTERERDEALKIMADNVAEASRQVEASDKLYRQMCARLSAAEADSKRLDWLLTMGGQAWHYFHNLEHEARADRAAIDAALRPDSAQKENKS